MKTLYSKNILLVIALAFFTSLTFGQSPQGFSYQAVIRDGSGVPIPDKTVGMKFTLQNTAGTILYSETQSPTTSKQGVVSVTIGTGTKIGTAAFSGIPWSTGDVLLKV